jgi:hypothetical protein
MLRFLDLAALGADSRSLDESNIRDEGVLLSLSKSFAAEEPGRLDVPLSNEGLGVESTEARWKVDSSLVNSGDGVENWVFGVVAGVVVDSVCSEVVDERV